MSQTRQEQPGCVVPNVGFPSQDRECRPWQHWHKPCVTTFAANRM
jgi:hypothetical protein